MMIEEKELKRGTEFLYPLLLWKERIWRYVNCKCTKYLPNMMFLLWTNSLSLLYPIRNEWLLHSHSHTSSIHKCILPLDSSMIMNELISIIKKIGKIMIEWSNLIEHFITSLLRTIHSLQLLLSRPQSNHNFSLDPWFLSSFPSLVLLSLHFFHFSFLPLVLTFTWMVSILDLNLPHPPSN